MKNSLLKRTIFSFGLLITLSLILTYSLLRAQITSEVSSGKEVKYTSQHLRDPFQSPFEMIQMDIGSGEPEATIGYGLPHLQVQGMIWGSETPQAIINNTVVKVGEVIEDAEILDIRKEGVYVLYKEKRYILRPAMFKQKGGK